MVKFFFLFFFNRMKLEKKEGRRKKTECVDIYFLINTHLISNYNIIKMNTKRVAAS